MHNFSKAAKSNKVKFLENASHNMPSLILKNQEPSLRLAAQRCLTSMEKSLNFMLSSLSEEEMDIAAKTSYQYLKNPCENDRAHYAKRMARRYLESKKDVEVALKRMKATISFRKELDVDGLRLTFDGPHSNCQLALEKRLERQTHFVHGFDKDGRSTHIFVARRSLRDNCCVKWTIKEAVYTLERAIACSRASDSSVNAIIDLNGFSMGKHAPPLNVAKIFLTTLRSHYAGQVNKIFLLDAPYAFNFLWNLVKPFVGTTTAQKIQFVSGSEKKKVLSQWYGRNQAIYELSMDSCEFVFDTKEYLYAIPFDRTFGQSKNRKPSSQAFSILTGKMNELSDDLILVSATVR